MSANSEGEWKGYLINDIIVNVYNRNSDRDFHFSFTRTFLILAIRNLFTCTCSYIWLVFLVPYYVFHCCVLTVFGYHSVPCIISLSDKERSYMIFLRYIDVFE